MSVRLLSKVNYAGWRPANQIELSHLIFFILSVLTYVVFPNCNLDESQSTLPGIFLYFVELIFNSVQLGCF